MSTRIILIRHGQTSGNLQKRYIGLTDCDLTQNGIRQIIRLKQRLKGIKVDGVYSSDRRRAKITARLLFKNYPVRVTALLREVHLGIFEGKTHSEIMKKYPKSYRKWLNSPYEEDIPKGEKIASFKKRVLKIFKKITSQHKNMTIAVITHAGPIKIILGEILQTEKFFDVRPGLGGVHMIEFKKGKTTVKKWVR